MSFRFKRIRLGSVIREDAISRGLNIAAYVFLVLLAVFAINFGSLYLGLIFMVSLGMQVAGTQIGKQQNLIKRDPSISRNESTGITFGSLGLLLTFLLLNVVVAPLYGLFSKGAVYSSVPLSSVALVGALVVVVNAIPEENFFGLAMGNLFAKIGGPISGIVMGAITFGIFHIPIDAQDPISVIIVMAARAIMNFVCFMTGRISTSMIAHIINNVLALGYFTTIGAVTITQIVFPLLRSWGMM